MLRPAKLDLSVPTELLEQARWVVQSDWIRFNWIDLNLPNKRTAKDAKGSEIGLNLGKSAPNYQFSGCFAISFRLLDCIGLDGLESQNCLMLTDTLQGQFPWLPPVGRYENLHSWRYWLHQTVEM